MDKQSLLRIRLALQYLFYAHTPVVLVLDQGEQKCYINQEFPFLLNGFHWSEYVDCYHSLGI